MASDSFNVNLQDCMNSLLFLQRLPALTLLCRDASGRVVSSNFSNEHLISGINIARVALTTDPVRAALEKVALRICTGGSDFWFSQLPGPDNMTYQQATHSFIEKIRAEFPLVFVDYSLQNPDSKGFHTRRKWLGQFVPRHQAISINGKNIDQMLAVHANMRFGDEDSEHQFRIFLFMIAHVVLHEITHLFITYLTQGRELTPPRVNAQTMLGYGDVLRDEGEAGLALEVELFGGTINYFHVPADGSSEGQWGTPYLKKPNGADYRILRKTIDDTTVFKFKFPLDHEEHAEDKELVMLGQGFGKDRHTDPLARKEAEYLLKT